MRRYNVGLAGRPEILDGVDFEGTEEWEWSRIDVREPPNVCPVVACEVDGPDLLSVRGKQCYCADRGVVVGDYI